jgi:hypothetical protein
VLNGQLLPVPGPHQPIGRIEALNFFYINIKEPQYFGGTGTQQGFYP